LANLHSHPPFFPSRHFFSPCFLPRTASRVQGARLPSSHGRPASLRCWLSSRCRAPPSAPCAWRSFPRLPVSLSPWRPVACTVELQLQPARARWPLSLLLLPPHAGLLLLAMVLGTPPQQQITDALLSSMADARAPLLPMAPPPVVFPCCSPARREHYGQRPLTLCSQPWRPKIPQSSHFSQPAPLFLCSLLQKCSDPRRFARPRMPSSPSTSAPSSASRQPVQ
jgi:hypothetical protein